MKVRFSFDRKLCLACGACSLACIDQHAPSLTDKFCTLTDGSAVNISTYEEYADGSESRHDIETVRPYRTISITEDLSSPDKPIIYTTKGCLHCDNAPCVNACPAGCLYKDEKGLTLYNRELCIGCRLCESACPFGAIAFDANGIIEKCDGCSTRLENGLLPACVSICPLKAITVEII